MPISEVTDIVVGKDSPHAKEAKFRKVPLLLIITSYLRGGGRTPQFLIIRVCLDLWLDTIDIVAF